MTIFRLVKARTGEPSNLLLSITVLTILVKSLYLASMLNLKSTCEKCSRPLPPSSDEAMICSFECTFCTECVEGPLNHVCPNCGGDFQKRPKRADHLLAKYPPKG